MVSQYKLIWLMAMEMEVSAALCSHVAWDDDDDDDHHHHDCRLV